MFGCKRNEWNKTVLERSRKADIRIIEICAFFVCVLRRREEIEDNGNIGYNQCGLWIIGQIWVEVQKTWSDEWLVIETFYSRCSNANKWSVGEWNQKPFKFFFWVVPLFIIFSLCACQERKRHLEVEPFPASLRGDPFLTRSVLSIGRAPWEWKSCPCHSFNQLFVN